MPQPGWRGTTTDTTPIGNKRKSAHKVHSEVIPLIPRSSAMITAAFSPIAIAVL